MYATLNNAYDRGHVSGATFLSGNKTQIYNKVNKLHGKNRITLPKIENYLRQKNPYTLHKRVIHNFKRNHYFINNIYSLYEADLIDLSVHSNQNDGFKFILTVIDVFSKYAFAIPMKNKNAQTVCKAFRTIIDTSGHTPKTVQSDRGSEFKNKIFKAFLSARKIKQNFPMTPSPFKASVVEIFNRTLKTKIFRFFTHMKHKNFRRYIDVLPDIMESYNNTKHSATKMKPCDVTHDTVPAVYANMHRKHRTEQRTYSVQKLQPNDYVRVALKKTPLDAGVFKEQWSREYFVIDKVINKLPHKLYKIRDFNGREVNGKFYEQQLQKIILPPDTVMKVLKTQGLGARKKQYVLLYNGIKKWI